MIQVAVVGRTPVTEALASLVTGDLSLALTVERTTADHVRQAVGEGGAAILDLPAGESREFVRALGARNLRVIDLGGDLRVPQVTCGFDESFAAGKRVVALPSAETMAAWTACSALVDAGLLHGDRLIIHAFGDGRPSGGGQSSSGERVGQAFSGRDAAARGRSGVSLETAAAETAAELGWIFEQRGAPPQRRVGVRIRGGEGLLVMVEGELGKEEAQSEKLLRDTLAQGREWVRVCDEGSQPDCARVKGSGIAEVGAAVDWFSEWILTSCALDPVWFPAHAAVRALRQMA